MPAYGEVRLEVSGQTYSDSVASTYTVVATDKVITLAELNGGKLHYWHDGGETTNETLTFTVNDSSGAGNATASATLTIKIIPVNDDPTVTVNTGLTLAEGATTVVTAAALTGYDPDNTPAQRQFRITANVAHGQLKPVSYTHLTLPTNREV